MLVYGNDLAFAAKANAQLDHLAQLHVNSVAFVFPIYQASCTASVRRAQRASSRTDGLGRLASSSSQRRA